MKEGNVSMIWYYNNQKAAQLSELIGKTLVSVTNLEDDEIHFVTQDGDKFIMKHFQDCCESVCVDDVCGDLEDLVGSPIIQAEDVSNETEDPPSKYTGDWGESETWTFYKLATNKGSVTIRWYGTSNGYYSERVDFVKEKRDA